MAIFPSLDGFGPTRATLHSYAQAINAIVRVHAEPRPHWWHTSLEVTEDGLVSDPLPLPSGDNAVFRINLKQHWIELETAGGNSETFPMAFGWTGTQMGKALISAVVNLGLHGTYDRQRFESDVPGNYSTEAVARFFTALQSANRLIGSHMSELSGAISPVQLWPHNFDLSAEWYGTRMIPYEEGGETTQLPAQLNLGFYPGEDTQSSYFYSNPWPFETDQLLGQPLPQGARWHTEGWQGTELPYFELVGNPEAGQWLRDFARTVFAITEPTLIS